MNVLSLEPSVNDLSKSLSSLNDWLVFMTAIVVIGLLLEYLPKEIREKWKEFRESGGWKSVFRGQALKPLAILLGAMLVTGGVAGEMLFEALSFHKEGQLEQAHNDLDLSLSKEAGNAATSAKTAHDEADKAGAASANALTLAGGARIEADSFRQEITDAKQQAADAVSRLAEAENKLADATQRELAAEVEVNRLKTPRSLVDTDKLVAALKPFSGTQYLLNVFMDEEAIQFTKDIANALDAAGWVRKQPPGMNLGVPTMKIILDRGLAVYVPACVGIGVSLDAHVKESLSVLQATPVPSLPKTVQAAIALKSAFGRSISPPDERNVAGGIIDPQPGEDTQPLAICVGRKP